MVNPTQHDEAGSAARHEAPDADAGSSGGSLEATRHLLHELRVHQIELELQNEELRRTQEQLEASRSRYFDLYDLAPIGYLTLKQDGSIRDVNFTAADLLSVPRGELPGRQLTRFILPADQDTYYLHTKELLKTRARQACELRLLNGQGGVCWVRLEATVAEEASGDFVSRVVVSNIDARKTAEDTLRASESRHRVLFENSRDALMTLAPPDWLFTSGNSRTVSLFGVGSAAEFVSHPPLDFSPERQPDGALSAGKNAEMIAIAMRDGSHYYTWNFRDLSGREFPASVLLTRLEIAGQPLLQSTVRDETEMRGLQSLLGQADRLASMGMLAAGVAHEINNPLAYILYNLESLELDLPKLAGASKHCLQALTHAHESSAGLANECSSLLAPEVWNDVMERARDALAGAHQIRSITKAIGAFSRVERSEHSPVDLNYAIQCASTLALNDIKFRAKLVLDLGELPAIWASVGKLSQIFLNLLINAAQAIDEGDLEHSRITIRTRTEGDYAVAEVRDTGKGIAPADLKRIFEPFFTSKPIGVGSGLGLSICQSIINEFGGDIGVESELGKGTCFRVRLPIRHGLAEKREAPVSVAPVSSNVRGRVLLVDDERAIRTVMARLLGTEHEVVTAESGRAARTILERDQRFDVILCDLMMPDMTGMDLHQWLAENHPLVAERVVFLSGGAFTPNAASYVTRVGNRQLEKPFESAKLRQLVSELVAKVQSNASTEPPPR